MINENKYTISIFLSITCLTVSELSAARGKITIEGSKQSSQLEKENPIFISGIGKVKPKEMKDILNNPKNAQKNSRARRILKWIQEHPIKTGTIIGAVAGGTYLSYQSYNAWRNYKRGREITTTPSTIIKVWQEDAKKIYLDPLLPKDYIFRGITEENRNRNIRAAGEAITNFIEDQNKMRNKLRINQGLLNTVHAIEDVKAISEYRKDPTLHANKKDVVTQAISRFKYIEEFLNFNHPAVKDEVKKELNSKYIAIPEEARQYLLPVMMETKYYELVEKSKK